uniref:Uncharacterized protein n=1 Tax=Arundo donax TaxID=35708 RepID=A0A0A8YUM2_ARUDO
MNQRLNDYKGKTMLIGKTSCCSDVDIQTCLLSILLKFTIAV